MTALATSRSWEVRPYSPSDAEKLVNQTGVSPLVARIMASRGITDLYDARRFLHPSLKRDWVDPSVIPGLDAVVDRLVKAIGSYEKIAVFGDFDVDGISATCLLTSALRKFGIEVVPFIPRRFDEGYGLSAAALSRLIDMAHPDLIVTVDTGIAGKNEVARLLELGIDVAVTDHHEPSDLVPQGIPVCDPKFDPENPCRELAGVGVALKIVAALGARMGFPDLWRQYTDIATLGTVSDLMLLSGENRSLVADGMNKIRHSRRPGLIALSEQAHHPLSTMTSDELAYSLIPRLNSAGRMADPALALNLLMATNTVQAQRLAIQLESINSERRAMEAELTEEASALVDATYDGGRVIVVGGEGWHEGVKGIVASRLVSKYHVPTLLFTISDGVARGSGRSVGSINLFETVKQCSDLLTKFGGHAGAVGVTLDSANLDAFRDRMESILSALPPEDFDVRHEVSCEVDQLCELNPDSVRSLDVLQPYGQGNEPPIFATCGVSMIDRHRRGEGGKHLSFNATDGVSSVPCIMFNAHNIEALAEYDGAVDIVYEPKIEVWHGRTSVKLHVRDVLLRQEEVPGSCSPETIRLVDDLFARSDEFTSNSELRDIANAPSFHTKVVGISFDDRQCVATELASGDKLVLVREPNNVHDPSAIRVDTTSGKQVGYLRRVISAALAPEIDRGATYRASVTDVTGQAAGGEYLGVNILVERLDASAAEFDELSVQHAREQERQRLSRMNTQQLTDELRALIIGDKQLLPAQQRSLDNLEADISTLCVMATGRGKSLIFHVHAARTALLRHQASIFVYPLRALVSDQAYHLSQVFDKLGMTTRVLTGETSLDAREAIYAGLAAGDVDIILTTPEFLTMHVDSIARCHRIGFVVIDEAHHAGLAKPGLRPSYLEMPHVLELLGHPTVLAVTATASAAIADSVRRLLDISEDGVIIDPSVRDNLCLIDERSSRGRDERLVSLLVHGEKTLVYVNSREQSVSIARMLRHRVWEYGHKVAFYNGGLTRADRASVEEAFRSGELTFVVATSAFGEGVNLPDVRHVVLYHLPFDEVEFNQMSGRAGRDGEQAYVHLSYNTQDARINERILLRDAPSRDNLVLIYRVLMAYSREAAFMKQDSFVATNADIAERCIAQESRGAIDDHMVSCAIAIFRELGFCRTSGYGVSRRIWMVQQPQKMDLFASVRYVEGLRALQGFGEYREWALHAPAGQILARINRPIVP